MSDNKFNLMMASICGVVCLGFWYGTSYLWFGTEIWKGWRDNPPWWQYPTDIILAILCVVSAIIFALSIGIFFDDLSKETETTKQNKTKTKNICQE